MEGSSPEVETVHGWVVAVELGSGRRCGDRGIEEGTALCDFGSALRHEPPPVFRRHPGVAPGRPHVRLGNAKGRSATRLRHSDLHTTTNLLTPPVRPKAHGALGRY